MCQRHLVSGGELGGVGKAVGDPRIGKVVGPVLDRSLAGDDGLHVESKHGEHGETSVLDLLGLELGEGIRVVSESQGVEGLTGVQGIQSLSGRSSVDTVSLDESHEQDLGEGHGNNGLGVDEGRVSEVVETVISEDGGTGLEPDTGIREGGRAVVGQQLRDNASQSSEHGPTSVDNLGLPVPGEGLRVSGETGRVPAVVTRVLTGEVRDLRGERSEVLGAIGSVELDSGLGLDAGSLKYGGEEAGVSREASVWSTLS